MGAMGGPTTVNPKALLESARAVKFDVSDRRVKAEGLYGRINRTRAGPG